MARWRYKGGVLPRAVRENRYGPSGGALRQGKTQPTRCRYPAGPQDAGTTISFGFKRIRERSAVRPAPLWLREVNSAEFSNIRPYYTPARPVRTSENRPHPQSLRPPRPYRDFNAVLITCLFFLLCPFFMLCLLFMLYNDTKKV